MKKIYALVFFAFAALVARATDYNEPIVVTVNGETSEQPGILSIVENGNAYDMTMKNFMLASEDGPIGVGNITMTGVELRTVGDAIVFQTSQTVEIAPGDDPTIPFWMGSVLPPVPVNMVGKLENDHLCCSIHIDMMESIQQIIDVTIGKGYQLQNQSFENWHQSTGNYEEPDSWHSFETATGSLASMAGHHIKKSEDAHSGYASACIYSSSIFGIVANGTMTTGRLNAGSMTASDVANHSYLDMSQTDVDGNADPFYSLMYSRPDSIAVWVKFKQGTANASYPYATISAVITDGTYCQDPEDKAYTNVVAKAKNAAIAQTGGEWVRVKAPFEYQENDVVPQAVLVTMSTNATPGKGSGSDELLVDDIEFIYNAKLTSLKVKGQDVPDFDSDKLDYEVEVSGAVTLDDIEAVADGKAAIIEKTSEVVDETQELHVTVFSGDMSKVTTYTIAVKQQSALRGDVNGDGIVNGTDIQAVINFIVAGQYDENPDVNKDGQVNGTDIQEVINIIVHAE